MFVQNDSNKAPSAPVDQAPDQTPAPVNPPQRAVPEPQTRKGSISESLRTRLLRALR